MAERLWLVGQGQLEYNPLDFGLWAEQAPSGRKSQLVNPIVIKILVIIYGNDFRIRKIGKFWKHDFCPPPLPHLK